MYSLVRKILFLSDPELVHGRVMRWLKMLYGWPFSRMLLKAAFQVPAQPVEVFGLIFPNRVGLAAGFDKNGNYIDALACIGFGFIEVGTVTPLPQPGNEKPRLFRLPADKALINRMGFNNEGAALVARNIALRKEQVIVGGNIGKNKMTANDHAANDYIACFHALYPVVDYFVVNVSSPNTPGLRELQEKLPLTDLLNTLSRLNSEQKIRKPVLLKIAPDLTDQQLDDVLDIVIATRTSGIIATNTTISRNGLVTDNKVVEKIGSGGLSGSPLADRSTEVVRYLAKKSAGKIPIIAAGGVFTAEDARAKLAAGASLVQVYTGFIYEGPAIVKRICKGLQALDA